MKFGVSIGTQVRFCPTPIAQGLFNNIWRHIWLSQLFIGSAKNAVKHPETYWVANPQHQRFEKTPVSLNRDRKDLPVIKVFLDINL